MKRLLIAGAIALMAGPAFADGPFKDWESSKFRFQGPFERAAITDSAFKMRFVEKGLQGASTYNAQYDQRSSHFYAPGAINTNTAVAIQNQAVNECSGDTYCNIGQKSDESVSNAQTNNSTGGDVGAQQSGDDSKIGGGYAN